MMHTVTGNSPNVVVGSRKFLFGFLKDFSKSQSASTIQSWGRVLCFTQATFTECYILTIVVLGGYVFVVNQLRRAAAVTQRAFKWLHCTLLHILQYENNDMATSIPHSVTEYLCCYCSDCFAD